MRKSIAILLIVLSLLLCVPVSYITMVNTNPLMNPDRFTTTFLLFIPVLFLILGLIAWIVYLVLKRMKNENALRYAVLTLLGLTVAGGLGQASKFPDNMKKRRSILASHDFEKGFMEGCLSSAKKNFDQPEFADAGMTDEKIQSLCTCLFDKVNLDSELRDRMIHGDESPEAVLSDPRMTEIASDCIEQVIE